MKSSTITASSAGMRLLLLLLLLLLLSAGLAVLGNVGAASGSVTPLEVASARSRSSSADEAACCLRIAFILLSCSLRFRASLPERAACASACACMSSSSSSFAASTLACTDPSATRRDC